MEYGYALGAALVRANRLDDALDALDQAAGYPAICLRHLIRGQFEEAGHALDSLDAAELRELCSLAVELGLTRLAQSDDVAAQGIWRLVAGAGESESRDQAIAFLAVLREDLGDTHGALQAWQLTSESAIRSWRRFGLACGSGENLVREQRALERAVRLWQSVGGPNGGADHREAADAAYLLGFLAYENDDLVGAVAAFAVSASCEHIDRTERARDAAENVLVLVRKLHDKGEYEQAADTLRAFALPGYEGLAASIANEFGSACREAGEPAAAERYYRALIEIGTVVAAAWAECELGKLLAANDRLDEAVQAYERASRYGVPEPAAAADFARFEILRETDPPAARELLTRMAEDPAHPMAEQAKLYLGVELESEDPAAATALLGEVAEGGDPIAMYVYAQQLQENGDIERAAEVYRQLVEAGGDWAGSAALSLGVFAERAGDVDQAREWWLRAVDDERAGEQSMLNLAVVYKRERRYAEAEEWWQRVLRTYPDRRAEAAAHLGEMDHWRDRKASAVEWYRITLDESTEPELVGEAAFRSGEFLLESGEYDTARELFTRAVEAGFEPFASSASELLARTGPAAAPAPSRDHIPSRDLLRRAAESPAEPALSAPSVPPVPPAEPALPAEPAEPALTAEQAPPAEPVEPAAPVEPVVQPTGPPPAPATQQAPPATASQQAPSVQEAPAPAAPAPRPEEAGVLFVQGRRLQEGGELDRAAELFRQVVDAGGEWAGPAALSLGSIADKQGDPEQARAWWSTAVDDPRAGIITMNNLALVAKRQRDLAEAERWFQRVMAADVERRPMCAAHIGEMHYWQGDRRQASQWYRVTLAESEEPELVGEAAFRTAEFLVDSGEYEPARELLVRAIETGAEPYASSSSNLLRQLATSTVQPPSDVPHRSDAPPSDTPPGN